VNDLRNRVRKLEQIAKEKKGGERIFVWQRAGEGEEEILSRYSREDQERLTIFPWTLTERLEDVYGPAGPCEKTHEGSEIPLSPDIEGKMQQIINDGQITSQEPYRMPSEGSKISSEVLDKEISRVTQELKAQGMSEREIEELIKESEESVSDLSGLMGNRKGKRWSIDQG